MAVIASFSSVAESLPNTVIEPREGASEAMVARVVHLGFEVRVELVLADGAGLRVQVTRGEAEELELATGDLVWVAPDRPRVAAEASAEAA